MIPTSTSNDHTITIGISIDGDPELVVRVDVVGDPMESR